jgi:adenylosuccinate synthase
MTNATYTDYPFTAQGVKFISRVYNNSPMANQIAMLPAGVFDEMNLQAITDLLGNASVLTRNELVNELEKINEGWSTALILLDEESN